MISLIVGVLFLVVGLLAAGYAIRCWVTARRLGDPYPPEAAEAPEGWQRARLLDEVGPGAISNLDQMPPAEANLRLRLMVDADDRLRELRELPHDLARYYVVPEEQR